MAMENGRTLSWTIAAWNDYVYWQGQDKRTLRRINRLVQDVLRSPFSGVGRPEALKGNLAGLWSRRIDERHRLVYTIDDERVTVISCRYHYDE